MSDRFTILTVCTGNICRSPLAEQLLAVGLGDVPDVQVHSAGTRALAGHSMDAGSKQMAVELGINDTDRHVARQVTAEMLTGTDLILALAREHRRAIVELSPRVSRRVFTLREFARLAEATSDDDLRMEMGAGSMPVAERLRIAAASVVLARGDLPPVADPADDDVIDPFGRGPEIYELSTRQLALAAAETVAFLRRVTELTVCRADGRQA